MIAEISCIDDIATLYDQVRHKNLIYRGQIDYSWELEPTIQRTKSEPILEKEWLIYKQFREGLQDKDLPTWEIEQHAAGKWLSLMQHYKLPTRLLDWTNDFHVGLYFACKDLNLDGALYVLNPYPLYEAAKSFMFSIPSNLTGPEPSPFFNFPEARFKYFRSGNGSPLVVPMKPLWPNEREQIQKGVFTVSNDITKPQDEIIKASLPDPANNFVKVRIKQTAKNDILQSLNSHHKLTDDYLMSPIIEIASRINAMHSSVK